MFNFIWRQKYLQSKQDEVTIFFLRGRVKVLSQTPTWPPTRCVQSWKHYCTFFYHQFFKFIFNWRITALQCCVGFCHMTTWISHQYTYVPSFLNLPPNCPHSIPPGCQRALCWAPCVIQQLPTSYLFHIWCACMNAKSLQLCQTLCEPMDCSPPGSSVHVILQARTLEWVAMPSSRGSSRPRNRTCLSYVPCIGRWVLYH